MKRVLGLLESSIGKKIVMAVSGLLLLGFVVGHMVGNLKIYQGQAKYDAYAEFLREAGAPVLGHEQFLWLFRLAMLAAVGLHFYSAVALTRRNWAARGQGYKKQQELSFSYASRTMLWGGVILGGFIVYHLLHLTTGSAHPDFEYGSVYQNVVIGFSSWPVSLVYVLCMLPLGLHVYHGMWSVTQTLALDGPRVRRWRRLLAAVVALVVTLGNISIPVAVLTGLVR